VQSIVIEFDVSEGGEREVRVRLTKACDYGIFQLYINGQPAGAPVDLYVSEGVLPTEGIEIGTFELQSGQNTLTAEVLGKNPGNPCANCYHFGLDALALTPTPAPAPPTLTCGEDLLSWTAVPTTRWYDVVRGDLGILLGTGDFSQAIDMCLADDLEETSLPYPDDPLPWQTFFFLVRDVCTGTYDSQSGQPESRDPGIDASPHSCP